MYNVPLDFFVSPVTKEKLTSIDDATLVDSSGNSFSRNPQHGFWNFIPEKSSLYSKEQWDTFQNLISNFLISYQKNPEVNVSYDIREDALAFGAFCKFHERVLDIGCGPHKIPSYIKYKKNPEAEYFGIDILSVEHPKELNFVQGMGEHLPFKDNLFDVTISGTSLLHYVNIKAGISEALRVTNPDGYLCIWLGVKSKDAPKPEESPEWYKKLKVPRGAENPFHYKRFSENDFELFFKDLEATVTDKEIHKADEWRKNVFYRVKKKGINY